MDYSKQEIETKIRGLELEQHRAVREFILGDVTAIERVREIDNKINELRKNLGAKND